MPLSGTLFRLADEEAQRETRRTAASTNIWQYAIDQLVLVIEAESSLAGTHRPSIYTRKTAEQQIAASGSAAIAALMCYNEIHGTSVPIRQRLTVCREHAARKLFEASARTRPYSPQPMGDPLPGVAADGKRFVFVISGLTDGKERAS